MSKVKYGLKKAYYAKRTIGTGGSVTYGTPVAIPGAVSVSLEQQGDINKFYADDVVYFQTASNNGYEGDFECALIPDSFLKDILGEVVDDNDLQVEKADAVTASFAFMFEFTHDDKAVRHVFYNCTATRPSVAGNTKEESIDPQTETITISAVPDENGYVKAKANPDADNYDDWYTTVQVPSFTTSGGGSGVG